MPKVSLNWQAASAFDQPPRMPAEDISQSTLRLGAYGSTPGMLGMSSVVTALVNPSARRAWATPALYQPLQGAKWRTGLPVPFSSVLSAANSRSWARRFEVPMNDDGTYAAAGKFISRSTGKACS